MVRIVEVMYRIISDRDNRGRVGEGFRQGSAQSSLIFIMLMNVMSRRVPEGDE